MEMKVREGGVTLKRHGNLWNKLISIENLELALDNARKNKNWQRQVKEVLQDKDNKLRELQQMLINKTYQVASYKEKIIYEPKKRIIYILPFYPDRIVHHALMNVIASIWDKLFIHDSYSCRVGKGQHKGSIRCEQFVKRNDYVLQCDISKFYPSINHDILMDIIKRKIKDKNVLWLIEIIVRSFPGDKNVPIGNYTSQWFGNIYLNEVDTIIKQNFHIKDYLRYCDDFLIFGNDKKELRKIGDYVKQFCKDKLNLTLSKLTLYPTLKAVDFLGYVHNKEGYLLLRKSTVKRFKKKFKKLKWQIENGKIDLDKARSSIDSMCGWMKHANAYHLKQKMEIDELRRYVMKGLPKHINSKQDYLYVKNNYAKEYWQPLFQALLDTRFEWYFVEDLPIGKEGISDATHKVVENHSTEEGEETTYSQYELRENPNAKIYRLGFTVEEVEAILQEE